MLNILTTLFKPKPKPFTIPKYPWDAIAISRTPYVVPDDDWYRFTTPIDTQVLINGDKVRLPKNYIQYLFVPAGMEIASTTKKTKFHVYKRGLTL